MFREVRSDFSAKIPSVLFKTPSLGDTQVQLGINGEFGCQTSKLLGTYYEIDSRLAVLATAFRYWAKVCRIFKERITARKRSLGQGNIFAPVCYSVHRGGSTWAGTPSAGTPNPPPPGRYTPLGRYNPPGRYTPWQVHLTGRYTPRQVLPGRYTPWAGTPPGRYTHPWAGTPTLGRYTPGRYTTRQCMLGYGQQAGGTHPTGMHSCLGKCYCIPEIYTLSYALMNEEIRSKKLE